MKSVCIHNTLFPQSSAHKISIQIAFAVHLKNWDIININKFNVISSKLLLWAKLKLIKWIQIWFLRLKLSLESIYGMSFGYCYYKSFNMKMIPQAYVFDKRLRQTQIHDLCCLSQMKQMGCFFFYFTSCTMINELSKFGLAAGITHLHLICIHSLIENSNQLKNNEKKALAFI